MVNQQRMPEAEVSLRLAFWLLERKIAAGVVEVAIDGAQVQTLEMVHFDLPSFMRNREWAQQATGDAWQCDWTNAAKSATVRIHSNPGRGDVVAKLSSGHTLRAECKKGPLVRSKSSQEYPLLREALGQLLTVADVADRDLLAVAVPHSAKFEELATVWREAPLIKRFGIAILTVDQTGKVFGFTNHAG